MARKKRTGLPWTDCPCQLGRAWKGGIARPSSLQAGEGRRGGARPDRQAVTRACQPSRPAHVSGVGHVRRLAHHPLRRSRRSGLSAHARLAGAGRCSRQSHWRGFGAGAADAAHALLDLHEAAVATFGFGGGDCEPVPLFSHGEVLIRGPHGELPRAGDGQKEALPEHLSAGQRAAHDGVESVRVHGQRADAQLEFQACRRAPVPPPALEIKTPAGRLAQYVVRFGRQAPGSVVQFGPCHCGSLIGFFGVACRSCCASVQEVMVFATGRHSCTGKGRKQPAEPVRRAAGPPGKPGWKNPGIREPNAPAGRSREG
jgi:hypothetical protein